MPPFAAVGRGRPLLRQVHYSIPGDPVGATRIDGAAELGIGWRVLLPAGLAFPIGFSSGSPRTVATGIVIATLTVIVVFMVFQRQFIQGLAGAVKG